MTDQRQYYACIFREGDTRKYTYHYDGEPLAEGDKVTVETKSGGTQTVIVAMAMDAAPSFPTKPILGKKVEDPEVPV